MSKVRPPYPAEFLQQMVELVRAGRSPAQLSREFGVTAQSITNWVGQATIDDGKPLPGRRPPIFSSAGRWSPEGNLTGFASAFEHGLAKLLMLICPLHCLVCPKRWAPTAGS